MADSFFGFDSTQPVSDFIKLIKFIASPKWDMCFSAICVYAALTTTNGVHSIRTFSMRWTKRLYVDFDFSFFILRRTSYANTWKKVKWKWEYGVCVLSALRCAITFLFFCFFFTFPITQMAKHFHSSDVEDSPEINYYVLHSAINTSTLWTTSHCYCHWPFARNPKRVVVHLSWRIFRFFFLLSCFLCFCVVSTS